jgi:hypothetical protein
MAAPSPPNPDPGEAPSQGAFSAAEREALAAASGRAPVDAVDWARLHARVVAAACERAAVPGAVPGAAAIALRPRRAGRIEPPRDSWSAVVASWARPVVSAGLAATLLLAVALGRAGPAGAPRRAAAGVTGPLAGSPNEAAVAEAILGSVDAATGALRPGDGAAGVDAMFGASGGASQASSATDTNWRGGAPPGVRPDATSRPDTGATRRGTPEAP